LFTFFLRQKESEPKEKSAPAGIRYAILFVSPNSSRRTGGIRTAAIKEN